MGIRVSSKEATQRQLRVGEQVRHILSDIFRDLGFYNIPGLAGMSITVSEVRISADMNHATVFVLPLGVEKPGSDFEESLNAIAPQIRHDMSRHLRMKYLPKLFFKFDHSFGEASKMDALLHEAHKKDQHEPV
jgi:ribosome-binding factor A